MLIFKKGYSPVTKLIKIYIFILIKFEILVFLHLPNLSTAVYISWCKYSRYHSVNIRVNGKKLNELSDYRFIQCLHFVAAFVLIFGKNLLTPSHSLQKHLENAGHILQSWSFLFLYFFLDLFSLFLVLKTFKRCFHSRNNSNCGSFSFVLKDLFGLNQIIYMKAQFINSKFA